MAIPAQPAPKMDWICGNCGHSAAVSVDALRIKCVCGYVERVKNYIRPIELNRNPYEIRQLAAICVACNYLRQTKHGARCTHKQCGCHGPEVGVEPSVMHGVAFSPALVNLLSRRPSCPDGRW